MTDECRDYPEGRQASRTATTRITGKCVTAPSGRPPRLPLPGATTSPPGSRPEFAHRTTSYPRDVYKLKEPDRGARNLGADRGSGTKG